MSAPAVGIGTGLSDADRDAGASVGGNVRKLRCGTRGSNA